MREIPYDLEWEKLAHSPPSRLYETGCILKTDQGMSMVLCILLVVSEHKGNKKEIKSNHLYEDSVYPAFLREISERGMEF